MVDRISPVGSKTTLITVCLDELESLGVFGLCLLALTILYYVCATRFPTVKQRSWILTLTSSATMSAVSLPLLARYVSSRDPRNLPVSSYWTIVASRFFQAYLVGDLTMGCRHYRSQINLLTGWIHHTVYIFIVEYAIRMDWSHIFCLCAVMEIPTFILALGTLYPILRADVLFATSFFATRITLHIALCISFFTDRSVSSGSSAPAIILGCIFPLHAFWFYGCLKAFVKRAQARRTPQVIKLQIVPEMRNSSIGVASGGQVAPAPVIASSLSASRYWRFQRRRGDFGIAMRKFGWDLERTGAKAASRVREMRHRLRAALPAQASVDDYAYVGLERRGQLQVPTSKLSDAMAGAHLGDLQDPVNARCRNPPE
ncbi:hypothetical protein BJ138DRAFT_1060189 [Hygrophoropsis aurantiaca]|uniref:Uncharacterized protein n=1 Tax=Hygrophoropsis aurantiaca TaxID=72124 RepID=A0ACB8AJ13_9AGAM|nr:hypothetical protein BJ138DRAFT_1060189 [Hygrophoropsis aurantiaca]